MKVFICEQDPSRANSMKAILGKYSYKVVTVQKNVDLFKQVNQQQPALIIVNESFNDNFGAETVNELKNNPGTSSIPIIFIGDNKEVSNSYPKKNNFVEVIAEPVRIKNLRHCIDRWTTLRSLYMKH